MYPKKMTGPPKIFEPKKAPITILFVKQVELRKLHLMIMHKIVKLILDVETITAALYDLSKSSC